jgi:hypothetical protein
MQVFGIALLTLVLTGCAHNLAPRQTVHFDKPGGSQQAFMQDRFFCIQQAQQTRSASYVNQYGGESRGQVVTSQGIYTACMGAKGYVMAQNGPFFAPPGSEIQMVE